MNDGVPVRKAIDYAVQMTRGLAAAHEKGILHRDLKPGNVFITTDGRIKILDFGLAKLTQGEAALAGASHLPTASVGTEPGMLLGTVGYMSPEQVRGQTADHRSDIFAFGAILYEMLSGQRAFRGETMADTISAILDKDPPDLPVAERHIPPALERIVDRCIEKTPAARFQTASDLGFALEALSSQWERSDVSAAVAAIPARRSRERLVSWTLAASSAAAAIAFGMLYLRSASSDVHPTRFSVFPPQTVTLSRNTNSLVAVLSPDGRRVAFVANRVGGPLLLWVRALDALEAQPLAGTDGAGLPFWSPDSRTLGFFAGGKLKTIDAAGGPVQSLCDAPAGRGGTWSRDGLVVFAPNATGGLFKVPAAGGQPTPLTSPEVPRKETAHRFPAFLPDGRHFLFFASPSNTIWLGSLDAKETTRLFSADSQAQYAAPGYLLFGRQGSLLAQPFDARRAMLTGEAVPIAEQLVSDANSYAGFSVSESGVLAYRTGTLGGRTQLTWVDRAGKTQGPIGEPGLYRNPALSPDARHLAVDVTDPQTRTQDIWLVDLARGVTSRFTFDPANDIFPTWSPDGNWIMFGSDRGGVFNLYQKRANGVGTEELVVKSPADMAPYRWTSGTPMVLYRTMPATGGFNLGLLPLVGGRTPHLFEPSRFSQLSPSVSPDERWIVYQSAESGRNESYVQSFPAPGGGKWQISKDGGLFPRWGRDGREVVYYAPDGRLMAVPIAGTTALEIGTALPLFEPHLLNGPNNVSNFRHQYDVTRDGQRFLLNVPLEQSASSPITVVLNWTTALSRR